MSWILYPNLYNDPEIDDSAETPEPPIRGRFITYRRLIDFGVVIEPGVQVDVGKHLGIFLRVPISIGLSPNRSSTSGDLPRTLLTPDEPGSTPFGTVRVLVGVQGRVLGLPVQPRNRGGDDVLEEDD